MKKITQYLNGLPWQRWLMLICLVSLGFASGNIVGATESYSRSLQTCRAGNFC